MLNDFFINSFDMVNIIYLWTVLTKKNNNIFRLLCCVFITSILTTIIELLEVNFVITYIMIITVIKIIYKIDLKEVILGFLLVLLIEMSLQLMLFTFIGKFISNDIFIAIITEFIIIISIMRFSKINLSNNITFKSIDSNILIYFVSTCSIYAIVLKFIWNYDNKLILNNSFIISVILCILVISQILTYLYVVKLIKEKLKLKVSNEYNEVINEIVEEIKGRQHDFVNYKNTIRGIVEVVDEKEVKEAINNYIKDEDRYGNKINELIYIDNVVIRAILYRSICKAKKYKVNLQYKIDNNILDNRLSYQEISNLLNNLLNNAFDEVIKDECIKKDIQIKILNKNKTSHLIIKNQIVSSSDINLNEMFRRGYSTKNERTRGYGLHNVQQIIKSNKGYIKVKLECGQIIFDIYFNNSSG